MPTLNIIKTGGSVIKNIYDGLNSNSINRGALTTKGSLKIPLILVLRYPLPK
jgi:hypothetical protein